eukprot:TRINITY_DN30442_c0_g1_i1.p1 TRINITY_DN30442_c0_g1~~TRINITY_DN30442_c0_g1_i1.p1  ORF type:complete len:411 (+),score=83.43 TRINITY_DN30442_c0_g1_i1:87-1319(+)
MLTRRLRIRNLNRLVESYDELVARVTGAETEDDVLLQRVAFRAQVGTQRSKGGGMTDTEVAEYVKEVLDVGRGKKWRQQEVGTRVWNLLEELQAQQKHVIGKTTYNTLAGFMKHSRNVTAARSLYRSMLHKGIPPTMETFVSIFSVARNAIDLYAANEFLTELNNEGLKPNDEILASLLALNVKGRKKAKAWKIYNIMKREKVSMTGAVHDGLLSLAESKEEVRKILRLKEADGVGVTMHSCVAVVRRLVDLQQYRDCLDVYTEQFEGLPGIGVPAELLIVHANLGNRDEVTKLFARLSDPPSVAVFAAQIHALAVLQPPDWRLLTRSYYNTALASGMTSGPSLYAAYLQTLDPTVADEVFSQIPNRHMKANITILKALRSVHDRAGNTSRSEQVADEIDMLLKRRGWAE